MCDNAVAASMMSRQTVITLPSFVANYLESQPDRGRLVTDAVIQRMSQTMTVGEILYAVGFRSTAKSREWARGVVRARLTDEQRAETRRRRDLLGAGLWPEQQ
jgi:hypothetical protein